MPYPDSTRELLRSNETLRERGKRTKLGALDDGVNLLTTLLS
jgi:hypothetical protein